MIPVYQTMSVGNDGQGNCFNACIASILELPLREVARIHPRDEPYWGAWKSWLAGRGLALNKHSPARPPKGYSIASGRSTRRYPEGHAKAGENIHHAVVCFDGEVVHDPFPARGGFSDISHYWTLDSVEQEEAA